ncbi:cation-translocating P-type ATPase [Thiocapsa roseopersicina]|uniref:Sodium/potassium-transporting ATPase subunit alpha n=1 Tax=Thiocapsa roseopersicina TaxID=1058 RepID=A0A1H2WU40_THIRO|nr:cation-transporting P-type ATPase [Thiocapsa roseopersicina]SDW84130.1 sodium/potassium-transporting ATPase subunit alpha [Thiocapsa roseopersicina]
MADGAQIHEVVSERVFDLLRSRPSGLTQSEVAARRAEIGPNRLQPPPRWRWVRVLFKHVVNFFSILLDIASVVCFVAEAIQPGEGMRVLGWALLGVSVLNAVFAFAQEMRAERAMDALRRFLPQRVRVRREGIECTVSAEDLVPGDVMLLEEGDRVAADARLVEADDLLANNAPLTGESRSQPLATRPAKGRLIESSNIAFAGCSLLRGNGTAVTFATGHRTELGKIAALARDVRRPPSPLERETNRMVRVLTLIAVLMALVFFVAGIAAGRSLWVSIVFMLGIIVANVPEGLLPTLTLALSMASLRMARKQVLVKNLEAVESLGAVHTVCTDKTGTLTYNRLVIAALVDPVRGLPIEDPDALRALLEAALIASQVRRARTALHGDPGWSGDPLDVAIAERHRELFRQPDAILVETRRHFPFDLAKRREAGVFADGSQARFAIKGAWESLRPMVNGLVDGEGLTVAVDEPRLLACDTVVHRLSAQGRRVIAVASRVLDRLPDPQAPEESLGRSLVLHGFLALDDPIRPEVPGAVARCQTAGVRVLLITGDHPDTAEAVARACGILRPDEPAEGRILHGAELERLREQQLVARLREGVTVFARTTPEQKMKIVLALKRLGQVVAMTGDGVNDTPALKAADVGIAMGASGTDVAREAADIVLLDDNFASIVAGIEEGRAVFRNMQRFTTYVLASNIPEIVPVLLYILLPIPLALTIVQILAIDLGTDMLPAIGLGRETPERDLMQQPPRRLDERLLSPRLMLTAYLFLGLIQAAWSLSLFFLVLHEGGWRWGQELAQNAPLYHSATGITLASIVLMQIGNVVGRRSLRHSGLDCGLLANPLLLLGIATEILFSWAILYVPAVQSVLHTGPVAPAIYALAWLGIPVLFGLDYARKRLAAHWDRRRAEPIA